MTGPIKSLPPDPWGKMTASMHQFMAGVIDWYISKDGFKHELTSPRLLNPTSNQMITRCLACNANRTDPYSEKHTPENELIAVEVAHWQMNHREKCQIPLGGIKL